MSDYAALRADVHKHLQGVARAWLGQEMRDGRLRLTMFDHWRAYYTDLDAVDASLENAAVYADHLTRPLWKWEQDTVTVTPGLADYLRLTWGNTQAQNEAASAFFDAVAGRFDDVRDKHVEWLQQRTARLMAWLDANAARMPAERVQLWARYGMSLEARLGGR